MPDTQPSVKNVLVEWAPLIGTLAVALMAWGSVNYQVNQTSVVTSANTAVINELRTDVALLREKAAQLTTAEAEIKIDIASRGARRDDQIRTMEAHFGSTDGTVNKMLNELANHGYRIERLEDGPKNTTQRR